MAAAAAPVRTSVLANVATVVGVTLVFGCALFSVNNVMLDMARAGWNQILLIQGSFNPTLDAQALYRSASQSKALDKSGVLPEVSNASKIKGYDGRIIQQADQERQLALPSTFFKGLPGS